MKFKIIRSLFIVAAFILYVQGATAQQPKAKSQKEVESKSKKEKSEKTTIIIDGDNVTINGKPVTEYDGDNIIIHKKNLHGAIAPYAYAEPRVRINKRMHPPGAITISPDYNFSFDSEFFKETKPKAQLGVVTEKDAKGVKITEVLEGSAAAKAGLKTDDLITAVSGKKVADPEDLADIIEDKNPGEEVTITYLRAKKSQTATIKLGEQKRTAVRSFNSTSPGSGQRYFYNDFDFAMPHIESVPGREFPRGSFSFGRAPRMGIRIEDTEENKGVRILYVEEESVAEKAGLKKDDVISSINGEEVKDSDDARNALSETHEKLTFPMVVQRNGSPVNIEVKVPKQLKKTDL